MLVGKYMAEIEKGEYQIDYVISRKYSIAVEKHF